MYRSLNHVELKQFNAKREWLINKIQHTNNYDKFAKWIGYCYQNGINWNEAKPVYNGIQYYKEYPDCLSEYHKYGIVIKSYDNYHVNALINSNRYSNFMKNNSNKITIEIPSNFIIENYLNDIEIKANRKFPKELLTDITFISILMINISDKTGNRPLETIFDKIIKKI